MLARLVPWLRSPSTLRGMGWMLISTFLVGIFNSMVRHLTTTLHPFEIAFAHSFFGLLFLLPMFYRNGWKTLRTTRPGLHAWRGLCNTLATLCMTSAIKLTPLAKVAALSFSAPLFATVLALVALGEAIRTRRIAALVVGFSGTWLVFRPGVVELDLGALIVLGFSFSWGATMIAIKALSRTDSTLTITLYVGLINTPLTMIAAIPVWRMPTTEEWIWLASLGLVGLARQMTLSQAFKEADATAILPLDFLKLPWMATIGFFAFAEIPDIWTWLGGAVIFGAATYIAYRESQARGETPRATSGSVVTPIPPAAGS
ncbi:MAG: DMT family transporter [Rhodospirillales bacterium]|nr:DMT family transporter [Rhodospirillales bacterium]